MKAKQSDPNILLIVSDAHRPDRVSAYNDEFPTPNIQQLADDGETFEQCYSSINATDASITTILTGLYPTHHGIIQQGNEITEEEKQAVADTRPLPELISHESICIDLLERWHARGFDHYVNPKNQTRNPVMDFLSQVLDTLPESIAEKIRDSYRSVSSGNPLITADTVASQFLDQLDDVDNPWFGMVHFWDAHIPYVVERPIPAPIKDREYEDGDVPIADISERLGDSHWGKAFPELARGSETVGDLKRKYDAGAYYVDQAIGRIIEQLKESGAYEDTILIFTADHGESLTEHKIFFEHHGLYEPSVHVPLVITGPGFSGRESEFVQHFDLVPTILDLLGEKTAVNFDGVSLAPDARTLNRDAVVFEEGNAARKRGIRTEQYKFIQRLDDTSICSYCGFGHGPTSELYDLDTDPSETDNIVETSPDIAESLAEKVNDRIGEIPDTSQSEVMFHESQEVMERLESMGYK